MTQKRGYFFIGGGVAALALLGTLAFFFWSDSDAQRHAQSADPSVRLQAVSELRGRESTSASNLLLTLAKDTDQRVAAEAVRAIADRGGQDSLRGILTNTQAPPAVRGEAASGLGKLRDKPALMEAMGDPEPAVRAGAAKGLARFAGNLDAIPRLVDLLSDDNQQVRLWAISALNKAAGVRFDFEAEDPPAKQVHKVEYIKFLLRRAKLLGEASGG
jgi:HEAT repeat protein